MYSFKTKSCKSWSGVSYLVSVEKILKTLEKIDGNAGTSCTDVFMYGLFACGPKIDMPKLRVSS
jgi:hypothetical protein